MAAASCGLAAADPWRSRGAGAQGLGRVRAALGRARHLAADRAASGAADAVRDPRPFRRASALAAAARGLLLYDRLGPRSGLPASATVDVTHHPLGNALKRPFGTAFEYSDCVVDNSRLVIANAVDAAERGADIRTGARCVRADRLEIWRLAVIDRGHRRVITARALANASGAWTASVAETVLRMPPPARRRDQDEPDRRPAAVRDRQCLCLPEQRPPADLRQPLSARFHADRHRRPAVQGRSGRGVDGGGRRRLSLRRRQPVFSRAGRSVRRDQDGFRRQRGRGPRQPGEPRATAR